MKNRQGVATFMLCTIVTALLLTACGDTTTPTQTSSGTTVAVATASTTSQANPTTTAAIATTVSTTAPATAATTVTTAAATSTTVAAITTTTAASQTTAATTKNATTTAATTKNATTTAIVTTASTSAVTTNGEPGQELVGQLIASGNTDIRVKTVKLFTELKDTSKTATPKGVFMAVVLEIANLGKKPEAFNSIKLLDGKNQEYSTSGDLDASFILAGMDGFKSSFFVNPGFVGTDVKLYDVPKDATNYRIEADKLFGGETNRKPSAESFANNGGKGADSGAGQELVGKTLTTKDKLEVTITKVERLTEIKTDKQTLKPGGGVYLIVVYDAKNNGDKPAYSSSFYIKDSADRVYYTSSDFDVTIALSSKYKSETPINPGLNGSDYKIFEVTKDATSFSLVENFL